MTPLQRLRLAAALVHAVPSAELRLTSITGENIVVSAHPAADLDPCALRRVVVAAACPETPDFSERITAIDFGGSLWHHAGGVYRVVRDGEEQRWIPSLLTPDRIAPLLDDIGDDRVPEESMRGLLKPDAQLGVTLLVITVNDGVFADELDEIASRAAAAVFVEELCSFRTHCPDR